MLFGVRHLLGVLAPRRDAHEAAQVEVGQGVKLGGEVEGRRGGHAGLALFVAHIDLDEDADGAGVLAALGEVLAAAGDLLGEVEAVDGVDAYEKAQVQSFDLVLTDQNMPRLDGLGLTRKLREHPQFKTVPILVLTTESSDLMKQAGRAAGATGWLVKPFDPARLLEVINKVIR